MSLNHTQSIYACFWCDAPPERAVETDVHIFTCKECGAMWADRIIGSSYEVVGRFQLRDGEAEKRKAGRV